MKKIFLVTISFFILTSGVEAQQSTLAWDYLATNLADVSSYIQTVNVNGTNVTTAPTCVPAGPNVSCTVPVTLTPTGSNTISVTASRGGISKETRITGINLQNASGQPSNPRLTVTVTITVQQ